MSDYKKNLNEKQLQAVESIDGPVLVLAGAGTGKTQTISARIANILTKTDIPPQSILCLSFTKNAVKNMRDRLVQYIGPDAYKIRLHTFHSFCSEVIKNNPDNFILSKDTTLLDDFDKLEIIIQLIDDLAPNSPLKPFGDNYFYKKDILSHIQTLKRENISPQQFLQLVQDQDKFLQKTKDLFLKLKIETKETLSILDEIILFAPNQILSYLNLQKTFYQQGNFDKGKAKNPLINLKNALLKFYLDLEKNTPKQFELQKIYTNYQKKLTQLGFYDYEDMILFVIDQFKKDENLLFDYQEKYQYILVDEYQDANSAQNEILNLLTKNDEKPNLFVVGDDDQSIFRFQGANLENIYEFHQNYKPKTITLNNNYRSQQTILDISDCVIQHNQNRIAQFLPGIDKSLTSALDIDSRPITLFGASDKLQENYFVAQNIKKLIDGGVKPNEIAVIYRQNNDVLDLLPLLEKLQIKYSLSNGNNILSNTKIKQLITLLRFIQNPKDELLFPILAYDFIGLSEEELYNFYRQGKTCRKIKRFQKRIARCRQDIENCNLNRAFNRIIRRFKILKQVIQDENYELLSQFNAFYDQLKKLSLEKNASLADFLHRVDLFIENDVALESDYNVFSDDSVNLLTVHKAKGLEFQYVFVINLISSRWGESRSRQTLKLPLGILRYEVNKTMDDLSEEDRRLFYVALTRAKQDLFLTYAGDSPSQFLAEIKEELINKISVDNDFTKEALLFNFKKYPPLLTNEEFAQKLKQYIQDNYSLSPTHLNSYLKCPLCFYYKTILRIPQIKNKHASYGTAVHSALSFLLKSKSTKKDFLNSFQNFLKKENLTKEVFEELWQKGQEELSLYFDKYQSTFDKESLSEFSFKPCDVHLDNVPITGNIDKVEILDNNHAIAVDFKTGNPSNHSYDADYRRQILFYKLLADNCPQFKYTIDSGLLDYIQGCQQKKIEIKEQELDDLKKLIKEVYHKIINLEFNQIGEKCDDKAHIHQFQKI